MAGLGAGDDICFFVAVWKFGYLLHDPVVGFSSKNHRINRVDESVVAIIFSFLIGYVEKAEIVAGFGNIAVEAGANVNNEVSLCGIHTERYKFNSASCCHSCN